MSSSKKAIGTVEGYEKILSQSSTSWAGSTYDKFSALKSTSYGQSVTWTTYKGSSYQRIESFMQAVEKLNTAYSKDGRAALPLYVYSKNVAYRSLYDGFVDIVVTFPCRIRLAGVELLNPWNNKLSEDKEYDYWRYLPRQFSIFRVNDEDVNRAGEQKTYENDVAKSTYWDGERSPFRPLWYNSIQGDDSLTFLGSYDVNWENISSYKCFFKFNETDRVSVASEKSEMKVGTATWECKQLVIRIFKGYADGDVGYQYETDSGKLDFSSGICDNICRYILDRELDFGTTVNGERMTLEDARAFYETYLRPPGRVQAP